MSRRGHGGAAIKTKELNFQLGQVQDFTPTPMTISTETWYTGYDPYTLEPVFSAKTKNEKLSQRQFFFWYDPQQRNGIEKELRRIGRADLIGKLYSKSDFKKQKGRVSYDDRPIGSQPKIDFGRAATSQSSQYSKKRATNNGKTKPTDARKRYRHDR